MKDTSFLSINPAQLMEFNIENAFLSLYDWFCMPCGTKPRSDDDKKHATFYMGVGRSNVYTCTKNSWVSVDDIGIELPPNTLVNAEVVYEMTKEFMLRRATHLHSIPRGVTANGLRAVLRTLHRPKDPP